MGIIAVFSVPAEEFALGEALQVDPDMTVDSDALDALFVPTIDGRPRAGGRIGFTHDGYDVTLGHDDEIRVRSVVDADATPAESD